ncbi:MAG: hydantoinase B/oxoprolinase family protein, partial [Candidatus Eremiobacteraeota bacterium]|nr:hydantoinase B/oxoprolinase family protein [Candidatus Eremiobacteraeota bacterium]MBV8354483.1 hydantoinase B/oxoprolinase family protein [Candidatus Eremiobacteraeota bacterium]
MSIDGVTLALIGETFTSYVREMRTAIIRTAFSPMIHEGHDFSCAIMTPSGELAAASEVDQPTHLSALPWCSRTILARYTDSLADGDLFLCNDPYGGGTHLNDVALVKPVFVDGRPLALVGVMAHWQDIGGAVPGSLSGKATDIFQEGVRIPGLRIARSGESNTELLDLLFTNVREPAERRGDLAAMEGACRLGESKLKALVERRGAELVRDAMEALLDRAEARMRAAIATLPDGTYRCEAYLDNSGDSAEPLLLKLALTVDGERLTADFTGCPPEVPGPTNLGPAHASTATFTMTKAFLDPHGPINAGAMRPLQIIVPEGTMLNARPPAACGAIGEVRRALEGLVMGALGRAVPKRAIGDLKGASNITTIAWRGKPPFVEFPAGGTGGWADADGNNAVRNFAEGDLSSIQPVEAIELRWPLRVERCALRVDSGGPGERRGGLGIEREVRVLEDGATLSVLSDKNVIPPYGVNGGLPGAPNRFVVRRDGNEIEPSSTPGKIAAFPLRKGDIVVMQTAGGGGFGDPQRREAARLGRDLKFGYVSATAAARLYENGASVQLALRRVQTADGRRRAVLA